MSELMSLVLFLGFHRRLCLGKPVVTPRWFVATPVVLGIFIVLNITLYASDYFTGDGINDAVLYTLTNSLTGAGVGKYILPGLGLVVALVGIFAALASGSAPSPSPSASSWLQPAGAVPRRWPPWMPAPHSIKLPSW